MRLAEGADWGSFTAEQWFSATEVGFCWHARVKMAPLVTAVVEDAFEDGHGRLDAKIWGVLPVGAGGPDWRWIAQRYLAELPWNPMAMAHDPALRFGDGTDGPVRVWCREPSTYVDVRLDDDGDLVGTLSRTRKNDRGEAYPWEGCSGNRDFGGMRAPTRRRLASPQRTIHLLVAGR